MDWIQVSEDRVHCTDTDRSWILTAMSNVDLQRQILAQFSSLD
jgi:hypothetical protein